MTITTGNLLLKMHKLCVITALMFVNIAEMIWVHDDKAGITSLVQAFPLRIGAMTVCH